MRKRRSTHITAKSISLSRRARTSPLQPSASSLFVDLSSIPLRRRQRGSENSQENCVSVDDDGQDSTHSEPSLHYICTLFHHAAPTVRQSMIQHESNSSCALLCLPRQSPESYYSLMV
ncbi:hypothetical protein CPC08DRAFT_494143 [Agrocybe pediades]|nr:hypothetical protein CPC08DRAFT_494143 [Agrocybe pediades]